MASIDVDSPTYWDTLGRVERRLREAQELGETSAVAKAERNILRRLRRGRRV